MNSGKIQSGNAKGLKRITDMRIFREKPVETEVDFTKTFDPMRDLHLWTMWRTAVNGRIVDELRGMVAEDFGLNPYGKHITRAPLFRFIKFDDGSLRIANSKMDPRNIGVNRLEANQFVFYGVPRVVLRTTGRKNYNN